jgi:hypothetical protein
MNRMNVLGQDGICTLPKRDEILLDFTFVNAGKDSLCVYEAEKPFRGSE